MSRSNGFEFHIISQTHWDREWRMPFQQTRVMLVDMMDHLIELMENDPEYRHYHLDGQTILLEDYLEIRPERRDRLAALIADGRILVGPWYTLPEENLVDGECLVRNLLIGHAVAHSLGGVMKVGLTPTSYGQVSQMPQIYMGFGIDSILFHRGVPSHEVDLEYMWEGSDGTRILGLRPPLGGRFNFSTVVMNRILAAEGKDAAPYTPVSLRDLCNSSRLQRENEGEEDDTYYSATVPSAWGKDKLRQTLDDLRTLTSSGATTRLLMCGEGHDSMEANPTLPHVVQAANKLAGEDRFLISSLPDYIAGLKALVNGLKTLKGELRTTQKIAEGSRLYAGTLSSRMYLKQANRRAEGLLLKWAEPFSALLSTLGDAYPSAMLRKAWKYLLANHAHDSISGTGTDQVHKDMDCRFEQSELLARELTRKALSRLAGLIQADEARDGDALITLFNPLPFERSEVVQVDVDLPETATGRFRIVDSQGNEVDYSEHGQIKTIRTVQQSHGFPYRFYAVQHRVCFFAKAVPALGYKTYRIEAGEEAAAPRPQTDTGEDRVSVRGERQMENRHLRVQINANGTLSILDKATGKCFDQLNAFEDCGETGDSYEHATPRNDTVITSHECRAHVEVVESGPMLASLRVSLEMNLPEGVMADKQRRLEQRRACQISSTITLKKDARRADIVTRVNNVVRNHRLRVLFPLGIAADDICAEGQYDMVKRPIARPSTEGWIEPLCPTQPQLNFVDLSDGTVGCAVINQGLPEYEVSDDGKRTLAITLLRCFTHKIRATQIENPTQVGTQCLGEQEFRYAVYPHSADAIRGGVHAEAYRHNYPMKTVQSWKRPASGSSGPRLPMEMSGLSITPESLILSCWKQAENGQDLVIRFFNPDDRAVEGRIRLHRPITRAAYLDFEENVIAPCPISHERELSVSVAPKKIMTLAFSLS
jgi:mannosylglycerate hydrolase